MTKLSLHLASCQNIKTAILLKSLGCEPNENGKCQSQLFAEDNGTTAGILDNNSMYFQRWNISQMEYFRDGIFQRWNISEMEYFTAGILDSSAMYFQKIELTAGIFDRWNISVMEYWTVQCTFKRLNSQMEYLTDGIFQ